MSIVAVLRLVLLVLNSLPPTAEIKGKETFMENRAKLAVLSDSNQNYLPL